MRPIAQKLRGHGRRSIVGTEDFALPCPTSRRCPMKPPPPLNHIRSFECSARHLSFTLAANELGYTQAAVSNHVRALEHYLGRKLFIRYPRSLKLTEMGEAFLP